MENRQRRLPVRVVARAYVQVGPLVSGEVVSDGLDLTIDHSVPITAFVEDASIPAGEMSFSQYVRRVAAGDDTFVALPVFVMRGFRHRCFFVRKGSGLDTFENLAGKRIGVDGWPDSGNTWSRSLLRRAGVALSDVEWFVGPVNEPEGKRIAASELPDIVQPLAQGATLADSLATGSLDAVMVPWPPKGFYDPASQIERLLPDFRAAEMAYAREMGFYPGLHLLGIRKAFLDEHPWAARSLFDAFTASWLKADERLLSWTDSTPWLLDELEQIRSLVGPDWQANGVEPNQVMVQTFCDEMLAQGIIKRAVAVNELFGWLEQSKV